MGVHLVQDAIQDVADVHHPVLFNVDLDVLVGVLDVQVLVQVAVLDVVDVHRAVQITVRLIVERDALDNAMDQQHLQYIVIKII